MMFYSSNGCVQYCTADLLAICADLRAEGPESAEWSRALARIKRVVSRRGRDKWGDWGEWSRPELAERLNGLVLARPEPAYVAALAAFAVSVGIDVQFRTAAEPTPAMMLLQEGVQYAYTVHATQ